MVCLLEMNNKAPYKASIIGIFGNQNNNLPFASSFGLRSKWSSLFASNPFIIIGQQPTGNGWWYSKETKMEKDRWMAHAPYFKAAYTTDRQWTNSRQPTIQSTPKNWECWRNFESIFSNEYFYFVQVSSSSLTCKFFSINVFLFTYSANADTSSSSSFTFVYYFLRFPRSFLDTRTNEAFFLPTRIVGNEIVDVFGPWRRWRHGQIVQVFWMLDA